MDTFFSNIKALALDLDGTLLLPGNTLGGYTVKILRECAEKGMKLIICSGRSPESAEKYREILGISGPMVYFNGAEIADTPPFFGKKSLIAMKHFYPSLLNNEIIDFCVDISRDKNIYFQVYFPENLENSGKNLICRELLAENKMYFQHTGVQAVEEDIKKFIYNNKIEGSIKGMFIAGDEKLIEIKNILFERFGDSVYITRTSPVFLEVMPPSVSKGAGLKIALERLFVKAEETIAFGDEENDLPMFAVSGYSAAPENAKERIKEAADRIIAPNSEEGVAKFLEEIFL